MDVREIVNPEAVQRAISQANPEKMQESPHASFFNGIWFAFTALRLSESLPHRCPSQ
jgi:hypothetical protein